MNTDCHDGLSEEALSHATWPRNYGPLETFTGHARLTGPCGDTMEFWVEIQDDRLVKVSFITDGCCSSLAAGSAATCVAVGRSLDEALATEQQNVLQALGGLPTEWEHCALLAANTLKEACRDHAANHPRV